MVSFQQHLGLVNGYGLFKFVYLSSLISVNKAFLSEKSMGIRITALPIYNTNGMCLLKPFAVFWMTLKAMLFSAFLSSSLCFVLSSQLISYSQIQFTENSGLLKTNESTEDFSFKILADNTFCLFVADSKAKLVFMALFFLIYLFFLLCLSFFETVEETN